MIGLVEALSSDLAPRDRVALGRRIVRVVARAYRERHSGVPRWVEGLVAHYADHDGRGDHNGRHARR